MSYVEYMNQVLNFMSKSKPLRATAVGIMKQCGWAVGGITIGGMVFGPMGGLAGGAIGLAVSCFQVDPYDSLITSLGNMPESKMDKAASEIKDFVGSVGIDAFMNWVKDEDNRKKLLTYLYGLI